MSCVGGGFLGAFSLSLGAFFLSARSLGFISCSLMRACAGQQALDPIGTQYSPINGLRGEPGPGGSCSGGEMFVCCISEVCVCEKRCSAPKWLRRAIAFLIADLRHVLAMCPSKEAILRHSKEPLARAHSPPPLSARSRLEGAVAANNALSAKATATINLPKHHYERALACVLYQFSEARTHEGARTHPKQVCRPVTNSSVCASHYSN